MSRYRTPRAATPLLAGVAAGLLVTVLVLLNVALEQGRYRADLEAQLVAEAAGVRAELERAIERRTALIGGLQGYAQAELAEGMVDADEFEVFASQLSRQADVPIRSLQLAPQGVVTYVWPLEGNEAAVGHDLLNDPDRRDAVLETIEARATVVAGPLELLQGGRAIILRSPIFLDHGTEDETWWGLATVVADFDPLVTEAGLDVERPDRELSVRFVDGRRNDFGREVYGELGLFERDPVLSEVTLPVGTWELGLLPAGGWDDVRWPQAPSFLGGGLLFAILVGWLVWRGLVAQRRLAATRDDLAGLIQSANAPIVTVSADGRVTGWNREAEQLTGIAAASIVGRDPAGDEIAAVTGPEGMQVLRDEVRRVLATGQDAEGVELTLGGEGHDRDLLVNIAPQRDDAGRVVGAIVIGQDITGRRELEAVRSENAAMARASRMKDEFLAGMSHELRTPLNGVIGLSSILERETFGPLNDRQRQYVGQIGASGRHLLELINDVLDLARLEARREDIELAPTDPGAVARAALELVTESARHKRLTVLAEIPDAVPQVAADQRRLRQVLLNLLSNAVKFTDEGGRIGLRVLVRGDELAFEVRDTGIGIPEDQRHLLFEPFQQVDATLAREHGGTGLGLSITQRLVDLHGGRIELESEVGVGSTFTVLLPLATATAAPGGVDRDGDASTSEVRRDTAALRVLLAEDHEVNRQLLTDLLEHAGMEVLQAADGVEAVDRAITERPDVVLMDIQMPHRDGLEATRMLRADERTRDLPIVAVTALAMVGDAERCLAAGCDAYLTKPLDLDEAVALVTQLATGRRAPVGGTTP